MIPWYRYAKLAYVMSVLKVSVDLWNGHLYIIAQKVPWKLLSMWCFLNLAWEGGKLISEPESIKGTQESHLNNCLSQGQRGIRNREKNQKMDYLHSVYGFLEQYELANELAEFWGHKRSSITSCAISVLDRVGFFRGRFELSRWIIYILCMAFWSNMDSPMNLQSFGGANAQVLHHAPTAC